MTNIHHVEYYKIPHPFKRGHEIVVGDAEDISSKMAEVYSLYNNPSADLPRVVRAVVVAEEKGGLNLDEVKRLTERFEKTSRIHQEENVNFLKLREVLRFARGVGIGYLLYMAPQSFWAPIENLSGAIDTVIGEWAKWWIIGFFPVSAFIRSFGTGIYLRLPSIIANNPVYRRIPVLNWFKSIGARGRWNEINSRGQYVHVYKSLGRDEKKRFERAAKEAIENIERKVGWERASGRAKFVHHLSLGNYRPKASHPLAEEGRLLVKELLDLKDDSPPIEKVADWARRYDAFLQKATEEVRAGGHFPWGEIPKLRRLREDMLYHYLNAAYAFAPLKAVTPDTDPKELFGRLGLPSDELAEPEGIDLSLEVKASAFVQKARNLSLFLNAPQVGVIIEGIRRDYEALGRARAKREQIDLLEGIADGFEKLRNIAANLHFGDNPLIPNEKGKRLANVYHRLYLAFGRASGNLRNGYKKARFGFRPVLTAYGRRKRIRELKHEVDLLLGQGVEHRKLYDFGRRLVSRLGATWYSGLATAAVLLVILGSVFSFYLLGPGQIGVEHKYSYGVRDEEAGKYGLFTEGLSVRRYGDGWKIPGISKSLHWHLPPPLAKSHLIDLNREYKVDVYMTTVQHFPENLWEKMVSKLGGQLGLSFDSVKFTVSYTVRDGEVWANYDPDGLGPKRLMRDMGDIVEDWKNEKLADFQRGLTTENDGDEIAFVYDTYFRELSRKGVIKDYIASSFSRTTMSSNIFYGSAIDRLGPGIEVVLQKLDRVEEESRADLRLSDAEKEEIAKSTARARRIVQETLSEMQDQVRVQYGDLRKNPLKLKKYVRNPEEHIPELQDFETLWSGIQGYTWYLYNNEKALRMLRDGKVKLQGAFASEDKKGRELVEDLLARLRSEGYINDLVDIKSISYRVGTISLTALNSMQQRWQDMI